MALVDQKTPRLGLLLPFTDNFLQDDVERLRDTFNLLDVLVVTRDQTTGKIADDMLSDVIAKLDANGKLNKANLPSTVVQTGPDGKIDGSLMPSIAVIDTFPVPNEASMLGLQCERGDIAIREDLGKTFILTQMPPSVLSNWRELTSTNVTSVNGKTGAVTGLAASGANNDITSLNALSGPLRLGGDAAGDYDAVTLKQLRAASGGAGGASMNGVMNNFIGAVEWFMGTRAKLPAGYLQADGQIVLRSLVPDIVAAMQSGMLNVIAASGSNSSDAMWQMTPTGRGRYSWGDGDATTGTTIRLPDLNGVWVHPTNSELNSIPGLFLRGDGMIGKGTGGNETGAIGVIRKSAAPNITGQLVAAFSSSTGLWDQGSGAFTLEGPTLSQVHDASSGAVAGAPRGSIVSFTASNANPIYGNDGATEVRPASVQGIWIIRASGTFTAQNTVFEVQTSDAAFPRTGVVAKGGELVSRYTGYNVGTIKSSIQAAVAVGGKVSTTYLYSDATGISGDKGTFSFDSDGRFNSQNATIANELIAKYIRAMNNVALYTRSTSPEADRGPTLSTIMSKTDGGILKDVSFGLRPEWNKTANRVLGVFELLKFDPDGATINSSKYWKLYDDGTALGDGAWNVASDRRLKDNVTNIIDPLWRVMQINGVTWDRLDGGRPGQGLIAQEVEAILPTAVLKGDDVTLLDGTVVKNALSVDVAGVAAALHTEAIKSLVQLVRLAITDPTSALKQLESIESASLH